MYLFFDTETIGLPKVKGAKYTETDVWPRITQLAFQVYNADGRMYKSFSQLIKPNGWEIPTNDPFFAKNNMSTKRCEEEGFPIEKVLGTFKNELEDCKYLLAHNLEFDKNVVLCEFFRMGMPTFVNRPINICTVEISIDVVKKPYFDSTTKFARPSLTDLHMHLFGKEFDGAHDAGADVTAMANCFFDMKRKGLINIPAHGK